MGTMREIEWESCLLMQQPAPELEQRFERETGRPGTLMRYFNDSAWLADTIVRVSVHINTFVHIDPDLVDQAGLVVSQDNSCRFCFGVQRAFLRVLGMSENRISRLEQDLLTGDFSPRERAVIDFARRVSQSKPLVTNAELGALRAQGLSDDEIAELAGLIGLHLFLNRLSTFAALPPQHMEEFPDKWWIRLARPLLAVRFRRMRRRGKPAALTDAEQTGPLCELVNALDGLPLARDLRIMIDGMWTSGALPPRTITLLLAVVARALGSQRCEHEATRMLLEQGFERGDVDRILTHLSCPLLSDVEQMLVPLARETVWYQPARIQRRFAEIQGRLSSEQFLVFIGVTALANSVCRLGFLTGARA